ncbi:MAG: hypothetical protein K8F91_15480 [Candidatus Obscuribacterales bacterium]|nr:hypothetical protein [Candidatus Obscuribacterales bacterium]
MESTRRSLENLTSKIRHSSKSTGWLAADWGQVTKAKVRVEMIRENGAWKIKHQVWR